MNTCPNPCDHCCPDLWHDCVRPAGHSGYHSCQPYQEDCQEDW